MADPLRAGGGGGGGFVGFMDACATGGCGPGGLYPVSEACGDAEEGDEEAAAAALDDVTRRAEEAEAELARRTLNVQLLRSAVRFGGAGGGQP